MSDVRRAAVLLTSAAILGMISSPHAAAAPPRSPADPGPAVSGFQPYDLIKSAAATVRTIQRAIARPAADASDPRVYDIVARMETVGGGHRWIRSNSTATWGLQSRLLFAKDSAELSSRAKSEIRILAGEVVKGSPTVPVEINGYTDNLGSAAHGLKLSRARANAIKKVMQKEAPGVTFKARGFGEEDPIADNKTEEGRVKNRRVEITVKDRAPLPAPETRTDR
ncbi:OmpA family protein [Streptomyces sp. NPDC050428]|uniref:OmpA family protein n=1 Tax=Streptomyces sp. NPDC050428 TaxID=3155757 RepID=UPI00342CDDA1